MCVCVCLCEYVCVCEFVLMRMCVSVRAETFIVCFVIHEGCLFFSVFVFMQVSVFQYVVCM